MSPDGLGYPPAIPVMQNGASDSLSVQTSIVHDVKSVPYPIHSREWENDMESLLKVEWGLISTDKNSLISSAPRKCITPSRPSRSYSLSTAVWDVLRRH